MNSMTEEFLSSSSEETRRYGREFASGLQSGDIVALNGQLGAGKTVFMRGITEFFNCEDQLSSPTFPLLNIYQGSLRGEEVILHHFDLYRIESIVELETIGFDEYLSSAYLSVVEWADRFPEYVPMYTAAVFLEYTGDERRRILINHSSR
jgi:tRNA threonylcarbamoyladenosine biosynthesis protein TsaE